MLDAVKQHLAHNRALLMAAAVADYKPKTASARKIKKSESSLRLDLAENPDILKYVTAHKKPGTIVIGFGLETESLEANASQKLESKKLDLIVANHAEALGSLQNQAVLIDKKGAQKFPAMPKTELANIILDRLAQMLAKGSK